MNDAHFHLVTNHFPILVPILGLVVLLLGFTFRSEVIKRVAYFIFILGAASTVAAFSSGEGAEEVLEHMGADHRMIHEHEEMAETFAMLSYALGLLSLLALFASWKKMKMATIAGVVVLLFSGVVIYMGRQTGMTGGHIKHEEARDGFQVPAEEHGDQNAASSANDQEEEHEEEHED